MLLATARCAIKRPVRKVIRSYVSINNIHFWRITANELGIQSKQMAPNGMRSVNSEPKSAEIRQPSFKYKKSEDASEGLNDIIDCCDYMEINFQNKKTKLYYLWL